MTDFDDFWRDGMSSVNRIDAAEPCPVCGSVAILTVAGTCHDARCHEESNRHARRCNAIRNLQECEQRARAEVAE